MTIADDADALRLPASPDLVGSDRPVPDRPIGRDPALAGQRTAAPAGSYRNPVVAGWHPDPSVCRVGDDYYLATSTFEYLPGIPILHSRDLVSWTTIGHAVHDLADLRSVESSQGLFAPTLRHIDGRFVMITTVMPSGRSFFVTAQDPAGPWADPVFVQDEGTTMDPSLFQDSDGIVYYTRHGDGRHGAVYQAVIDLESGALDGPVRRIWGGTGGIWPEGPHLYRIEGTYYLLISEGGTAFDHSLTVARSTSPWGPFEVCPDNPILTHADRPELPIQAVGHGDLVDAPDGTWWMVLLGVRPIHEGVHVGRETLLAPVTWEDGWPVVHHRRPLALEMSVGRLPGGDAATTTTTTTATTAPTTDVVDFTVVDALGPEWIWLRAPLGDRCRLGTAGLDLVGDDTGMDRVGTPAFVGRRQPGLRAAVATEVDVEPQPGDAAGLVVRLDERRHHELVVTHVDGRRVARLQVVTPAGVDVVTTTPINVGPIVLRVTASPDDYAYEIDHGDGPTEVGRVDARTVAIEGAESFTGVVIGLHSRAGGPGRRCSARFTWFRTQT